MEKKMTVREFVEKYNKLTNAESKNNLVKSVIKNKYITYETKVATCEHIIKASYFVETEGKDGIKRKKLYVNSPAKYMLYCLNIVKNYTDININFKNNLEEFNLLNGNGSLDMIFANVSDREIKEFRKILDMIENDLIQNEYETHAFINNQVERFSELTSATLSPLLKVLIDNLENLDDKKIEKVISKFTK